MMLTIIAAFINVILNISIYLQCHISHHNMHHVVPSLHSIYQSSHNYIWYPAHMGHRLWFIIQIACAYYPLEDCWHFTMQSLQYVLVLESVRHVIGEIMIYRVIYIFLYESH
jgi:hypothetical protein